MNFCLVLAIMVMRLFGFEDSFAQDTSKPNTIGHVGTLPPDEVISTVTDQMGIEIERFQFKSPRNLELRFTGYTYKNGKEHLDAVGEMQFPASSDKYELMLIKHNWHYAVTFGVYSAYDVESLYGFSGDGDDDLRHTAKHPFALTELARGHKIPFYVFAADPDRVTEFGPDESEDRIKQYTKENKWVWVGYVELK